MNNMNSDRKKIVIIAGPSGSGKNSVLKGVLEKCDNCTRLVTATTRSARVGEVHGKDYYFFTKEEFLQKVEDGSIPEYWHATRTDRYYGTYIPDLDEKLAQGKIVLAQVQIEGMRFFKKEYGALSVFIQPDSLEELRRRVLHRQNMPEQELQERLLEAEKEITQDAPEYDYIIVNKRDKLEEAIDATLDILRKEQYL